MYNCVNLIQWAPGDYLCKWGWIHLWLMYVLTIFLICVIPVYIFMLFLKLEKQHYITFIVVSQYFISQNVLQTFVLLRSGCELKDTVCASMFWSNQCLPKACSLINKGKSQENSSLTSRNRSWVCRTQMSFILIWQNMKSNIGTENEVRKVVALNFVDCD